MINPTDIFIKITTQKYVNGVAKNTVANIFTKDRQSICPGEIIALNTDEPGVFSAKIKKMLSNL